MRKPFAVSHLISFGLGCVAVGVLPSLSFGQAALHELLLMFSAINVTQSMVITTGAVGLGILAVTVLMMLDEGDGRPKKIAEAKPAPANRDAELKALSASLDVQINELLSVIVEQVQDSAKRNESLARAHSELDSVETIDQLRSLIQQLIGEHKATQANSQRFAERFKLAQAKISSLRKQLDKAERLATTDALTGISNRRRLIEQLELAISEAHLMGAPMCLVMTDLDHFKKINDTFGHPVGDAVLAQFADLICKNVRSTDTVGRYGGEEFGIVLPGATSGDAVEIVKRLQAKIRAARFGTPDSNIRSLTASFGIASIEDEESPSHLLGRADRMLYEAKNAGRDRYALDSAAVPAAAE